MTDIRWKQRLSNFQKSLAHLAEAVEIEVPSIIQQAGTIQVSNRFGLKSSDLEDIIKTLEQFDNISEAIIFGSRAKGNYKHDDLKDHIDRVGIPIYHKDILVTA